MQHKIKMETSENIKLFNLVDRDPRIAKWNLTQNPTVVVSLVLFYLAFVMFLGPKWMKNRRPFELQKAMVVYSFVLASANAWVFHKLGVHGWYGKYSWFCEPYDNSDKSLGMTEATWWLLFLKLVELVDTVIFVLRKKTSQVTFLHVLHHALIPVTTWYLVVREPTGYNTMGAFINCFVHIIMYTYYGLAAIGPEMQKYLWWKKYVTVLQIAQFLFLMAYWINLILTPTCKISTDVVAVQLSTFFVFLVLFMQFFVTSYKPKNTHTRTSSLASTNETSNEDKHINMTGNKGMNGHNDLRKRLM